MMRHSVFLALFSVDVASQLLAKGLDLAQNMLLTHPQVDFSLGCNAASQAECPWRNCWWTRRPLSSGVAKMNGVFVEASGHSVRCHSYDLSRPVTPSLFLHLLVFWVLYSSLTRFFVRAWAPGL